jgi:hypothetical protein
MLRVFFASILMTASTCAFAHHDEDELGHHWASQPYGAELRFQMVAMLVIAATLAVFEVVKHMRRSRG